MLYGCFTFIVLEYTQDSASGPTSQYKETFVRAYRPWGMDFHKMTTEPMDPKALSYRLSSHISVFYLIG